MNNFELNENNEVTSAQEQTLDYDYASEYVEVKVQSELKENVFLGTVGAFVGCIIGAILIVVLSYMGYMASISGLVMGICALKGYTLLGKKMSVKGIVITAVLMIVTVLVSHMVSWGLVVAEYYEVDIITATLAVPMLVEEGAIEMGIFVKDLLMLYGFTALGAVPTIKDYLKK